MEFMYFLKADRASHKVIQPHYHNYFEIIYYYEGTGRVDYAVGDAQYKQRERLLWADKTKQLKLHFSFSSNTALLITPYTVHNECHDDNPSKVLALGFTLPDHEAAYCKNLKVTDDGLRTIMEAIEREFTEKSFRYIENINAYLSLALSSMLRKAKINAASGSSGIEFAINYFDEYFVTPISVGSIAAMTGYCADHFCAVFKRHTGFTPKQYIINRRMDFARRLISTTDLSLKEIAAQCGYHDYAQFNIAFKKRFGVTPSKAASLP